MSRGATRSSKVCLACNTVMVSKHYTDSIATWSVRKFCCQTCRFDYRANRRPTKLPMHSPVMCEAEFASRELLKLLLRYGLRNDGLPGLPANDLLRLAAELGVAA